MVTGAEAGGARQLQVADQDIHVARQGAEEGRAFPHHQDLQRQSHALVTRRAGPCEEGPQRSRPAARRRVALILQCAVPFCEPRVALLDVLELVPVGHVHHKVPMRNVPSLCRRKQSRHRRERRLVLGPQQHPWRLRPSPLGVPIRPDGEPSIERAGLRSPVAPRAVGARIRTEVGGAPPPVVFCFLVGPPHVHRSARKGRRRLARPGRGGDGGSRVPCGGGRVPWGGSVLAELAGVDRAQLQFRRHIGAEPPHLAVRPEQEVGELRVVPRLGMDICESCQARQPPSRRVGAPKDLLELEPRVRGRVGWGHAAYAPAVPRRARPARLAALSAPCSPRGDAEPPPPDSLLSARAAGIAANPRLQPPARGRLRLSV
mmetsp:Transcript_24750/g.79953  ORF Transcript_24750/g.79953 Transcript_24750/m.79953 type:complete len:374 (-) Transcript_24750:413-1534(-)